MENEDIIKKLKELIEKDFLTQEDQIEKLAEESGKTKTILKKQLDEYIKEKRKEESTDKNFALKNFEKKVGLALDKKGLACHILETQPCYYDKARNWWLWDWVQTKWERVDETDILNAIETQAVVNVINSKEKNEMLEALRQESRKKAPAEIKPTWIQFKNEIMDIETGERFRALPCWFVTNPIPWELHKEDFRNTPVMDKIFEEWVGKDYVQTLYEILAYCLLPDYPIHRIFCFYGSGLNGKTKFFELLRKFIGKENCASTELDTLLNSRFEVTYRLHKKLVCQIGETNFNEISRTSILKKLCGGDLIGYEYKNKDAFQDKNYAKILISTNNLPTTTDKTIGFYRRWTIIDFPNTFSEKKDILQDIPKEEYSALALKCALILSDLLSKRTFHNEGDIDQRMKKYEDYSDPLGKFVNEFVEEDIDGYISKKDFKEKFDEWCKENRFRGMSDKTISKKMKLKDIEAGRKHVDWLFDGKGGQIRVWLDVKWKE